MRTATIPELKQELQTVSLAQLSNLCLRLAKFKKENKELLTYLLFEETDLESYLGSVKKEISRFFSEVNASNLYFAKKTIRKILRITNKHIRYTGSQQAEVELLLHFCSTLRQTRIPLQKSTALHNLYLQQVKKIGKAIAAMHEDLQYDYTKELAKLEE
ncbi:MAG: hypothetical protein KF862_20155 [Chitinophagaceae bacterium]|nr:hypothetical protein [Chitinophagaceae bacterium]